MSQRRGPRRGAARPARQSPFSPGMLVAIVVAGILVCSLIASSMSAIFLDAGAPTPDPGAPPPRAGGQEYENELRAAIEANPDDAAAHASLGNVLALRGATEEAIAHFERAVEIAPDDARYRRDFALTLSDAGKFADAELQFERAVELDPNDAEALYFLGALYEQWQPPRTGEALDAYRRAAAAAPESLAASQARDAIARLEAAGATPVAGT